MKALGESPGRSEVTVKCEYSNIDCRDSSDTRTVSSASDVIRTFLNVKEEQESDEDVSQRVEEPKTDVAVKTEEIDWIERSSTLSESLKTEEVDLGYDCTEHTPNSCSPSDDTDDNPQQSTEDPQKYDEPLTNLKPRYVRRRPKRRFTCEICAKKFYQRGHLSDHMFTHTGVKEHACNLCDKKFALKSSLKTHLFLHTGDKPIKCTECDKRFSLGTNFRRHMLTHTGARPYPCPICKKRFADNHTQNRHVTVHTGERLHECPACGKKFTDPSYLKRHKLTHFGENLFECKECAKKIPPVTYINLRKMTSSDREPEMCTDCEHKSTLNNLRAVRKQKIKSEPTSP